MRKFLSLACLTGGFLLLSQGFAFAQDAATAAAANPDAPIGMHQQMKQWFIDGGWVFMAPILVVFIIGLAIVIERIITLNLATINVNKLIAKVDSHLKQGNIAGAREACKATPGPSAAILSEGLAQVNNGPEAVEKAVINYGSIQNGYMEKGMVWVSLFIALAPMLGFFGTVIGMVQAFDDIAKAGDIAPDIVASGIKVALLTTVFGLVVAMVLQFFYNYLLSKIEGINHGSEEAVAGLMELLDKYTLFPKKD